jgi:hypothetical protein
MKIVVYTKVVRSVVNISIHICVDLHYCSDKIRYNVDYPINSRKGNIHIAYSQWLPSKPTV